MINLIVKGKPADIGLPTDIDFRFYKEDGTPIMIKGGVNGDGEEYHAGQISSSIYWAKKDAVDHFEKELKQLFPEGYVIIFDFSNIE